MNLMWLPRKLAGDEGFEQLKEVTLSQTDFFTCGKRQIDASDICASFTFLEPWPQRMKPPYVERRLG
jgi:hypothetical protein